MHAARSFHKPPPPLRATAATRKPATPCMLLLHSRPLLRGLSLQRSLITPTCRCSSTSDPLRATGNRAHPVFLKATSATRAMASGGGFPPQTQERQPGKEHAMEPAPRAVREDYKAANKLHGKVALVTGGDSGIGRAVCICFAREGATVAFTYVKGQEDKDARDTLQMVREAKKSAAGGGGAAKDPIALPADLGFEENCRKVVEEVVNAFGRLDILVNNAAEQHERSSIDDVTEESLERVFRTNFFSYVFMAKYAGRHMKEGAAVINTTSVNAYKGHKSLLDYTSTKGAIVAFTRALALQMAERGIRVNGVAPGPVWTPLIPASFSEDAVAEFGKSVPMQRAGQPEEIAPSYVFLASEDASYITGQVLHPNGGTIVNG